MRTRGGTHAPQGPVTAVSVTRVAGTDVLEVRWTSDAPSVDVAVAPSPGEVAGAAPRHAGVTGRSLRTRAPAPAFVRVAPTGAAHLGRIAAERRLPVPGARNLRDVGGYPTVGGGYVRWGQVYRSEALSALAETGCAVLASSGVQTVLDLREDVERYGVPVLDPAAFGARAVHVAIRQGAADTPEIMSALLSGEVRQFTAGDLQEIYHGILERDARAFARVFQVIATPGSLPALLHCAAGKDRTGLAVALLLTHLGVPRRSVVADWALSVRYRPRRADMESRLAALGIAWPDVAALFGTPRGVLSSALDALLEEHGSVANYLVTEGGSDPAELLRLRTLLVVPAQSGA